MRLNATVIAVCSIFAAGPAAAHGTGLPVGLDDLWHHWNFDPWLWAPLVLAHWLYGRGVLRLWARAGRGRGISFTQAAAFPAGGLVLAAALISPLDALGATLFSAHMAQHALLVAIAPPLLLAGFPGAALPWALPQGIRHAAARHRGARWLARPMSRLLHPLIAATVHGIALWLWHAPALFDAALESPALHTLEHVSFLGTGLLFWQSLIRTARTSAMIGSGIAAGFLTLIHSGFLSALITFAPRPLYAWYTDRPMTWGMDALDDQQLAGLLMGAPMGMIYLLACLGLAARLLSPPRPFRGAPPERGSGRSAACG